MYCIRQNSGFDFVFGDAGPTSDNFLLLNAGFSSVVIVSVSPEAERTSIVIFGLLRVSSLRLLHVYAFYRVTRRTPSWLLNTSPTSTTTSDIWSPFRPSHRITWPVSRWAIETVVRLLNPPLLNPTFAVLFW
jgi:hypothetical protein